MGNPAPKIWTAYSDFLAMLVVMHRLSPEVFHAALSWPSSILRFLSGYMRRLISDAMKQVKATMPLGAPQNRLHIDNIMFFRDARGRWSNRLRGSILYVGIRFPLLQDTGVPVLLTNGLGESLFWPCMRIWRPSSA